MRTLWLTLILVLSGCDAYWGDDGPGDDSSDDGRPGSDGDDDSDDRPDLPDVNNQCGGPYYREVTQLTCDGGERVPDAPIQELCLFGGGGTFTVTWVAFETYIDYAGDYQLVDGQLSLTPVWSNHIPDDVDLEGTLEEPNASGEIVLRDMWLGTFGSDEPSQTAGCGHRFARF